MKIDFFQNLAVLIGRLGISSLYIWAAAAKLANWQGTVAYMESKHFPMIPFFLPAAILIQFVGALSIALGYYTRIGALILICFTLPATIKMHNFWNITGDMRVIEKTFFMKDIAIIGGLLLLLVFGAKRFSFDG